MIPKIIHYCWFGRGLMPKSQKDCIRGWKRLMPDYTFMRWDESTFPLDKYPLAKFACEAKRYALASDVCRYNVLAEHGGIYLDTDVELFRRLDEFLDCNFFTAVEIFPEFETEKIRKKYLDENDNPIIPDTEIPHFEVLTSSIGCCKDLKLICDIRDYYNNADASLECARNYREWVNNDRLLARQLTHYGFRYRNETQYLQNEMIVYQSGIFGHAFCPDQRAIVSYHHNSASWLMDNWSRTRKQEYFFDTIGLLPFYKLLKRIKKILFL